MSCPGAGFSPPEEIKNPWQIQRLCWLSYLLLEVSAELRMYRTYGLILEVLDLREGGCVAFGSVPPHWPEEPLCPPSSRGPCWVTSKLVF